jgi:spermidine/putrescine-binding protein
MRETIGMALKFLGYSLNSTNPEELEQARDVLLKQKPLVKAYISAQPRFSYLVMPGWRITG